MDVGQDNFRFTLDDPEKKSRAIRQPQCAELHLSSLDRFNSSPGVSQTLSQLSFDLNTTQIYNKSSSQCVINTQRSLLYGYFNRIALTEMQIYLRVPTIITGVNNIFIIQNTPGGVGTPVSYTITVPQGYYTTSSLAGTLTAQIRAAVSNLTTPGSFTVTGPNTNATALTSGQLQTGFVFNTGTTDTIVFIAPTGLSQAQTLAIWKFHRLIGTNALGFTGWPGNIPTPVLVTPNVNWLPTDYIDIVSKALTNYKDNAKDTNSSEAAPQGVIGRIYLTDVYTSVTTGTGYADPNCIGSGPIVFTKKWNNPNWSQWSPNQSLNSIDITLLDMWGNPLYYDNSATMAGETEWQMTIVASE